MSEDCYKTLAIQICRSVGKDPFQMVMTDVLGPLTRPESEKITVVHDILLQEPQWTLYRELARQQLLLKEKNAG